MLGKLFSSKEKKIIPWNNLNEIAQLEEVDEISKDKPVLIFKHSTSCSISSMVLQRFERAFNEEVVFEPYFLDLLAHRDISNKIEERYDITHQSPQAILIRNGKIIFHSSHVEISYEELNAKE